MSLRAERLLFYPAKCNVVSVLPVLPSSALRNLISTLVVLSERAGRTQLLKSSRWANIYHQDPTAARCHCERNNKQPSTIGNEKCRGAKEAERRAVSILSIRLCAHSTHWEGFIKNRRHAPSPPDSLCHPGVPDGEKGDRASLHHCHTAESSHIKPGTEDERWATYGVTAGADDAGGAHGSLRPLEGRDM